MWDTFWPTFFYCKLLILFFFLLSFFLLGQRTVKYKKKRVVEYKKYLNTYYMFLPDI